MPSMAMTGKFLCDKIISMTDCNNSNNSDKTVYILDSYGLIYRAYFALINHPLTNTDGQNISALVIFFKNLKALISKYKPAYLAAAFDSRTPTFRHKMYDQYKANRDKTPEDLHAQVPWIEEILTAMNIPVLRTDGYEADDIIATVAAKCKAEKRDIRILSGDKDLLQLVNDNCKAMQPDKANGGWEVNGIDEVIEKWGIGPEKILDYLSLVGDSADNVPGVKGVGDKTALKLLNEYGTLEEIYNHAEEIKGALGEKIRSNRDMAFFSKKLITLDSNVPIELDLESFCTDNLNWEESARLLSRYGAMQIARQFAEEAGVTLSEKSAYKKNEAKSINADFNTPQITNAPEPKAKNIVQTHYAPCTKLMELKVFVDAALSTAEKTVAFDTETDGLNSLTANLVGFSLSYTEGNAIYVPIILPGEMFAPETIKKEDALNELSRLFTNPEVTVVMHNAKFDLHVLAANGLFKDGDFDFKCRICDTMIAAWILNPGASGKNPFSLETLGETVLSVHGTEFSDIVPKGKTFADIDLDTAYPYGAEDADFTLRLWNVYRPLIKEAGFEDLYYNLELKVLPILTKMEQTGIHLDRKILNEYSVSLAQLINETQDKIYKEAGHEFNIGSPKQLQTVLFEERGLKSGKKTKSGYSTDTSVLEELRDSTDDILPSLILDWRSYSKLQSTYVETLPQLADKNERIHTSFLQVGTATGRLSSRDPNLQNIPVRDENGRKIRSAFTAVPGTVLISADYSQIELVVLAHLSGDKNLSKAFIDKIDVHKATAALVYGISPEEVTAEQRRFAKTVNFGVMYGMSAFRLAKELGISRTMAQDFINRYFDLYSGVRTFLDTVVAQAKENGYVETITGRRRYIPEINSQNKLIVQGAERIAVNTPIQGTAADIVKTAMINVDEEIKKQKLPVKMLLQVHDELIFECPDSPETIEKAISIITDKMENAIKLSVPLRVSVEYGKSWGNFH